MMVRNSAEPIRLTNFQLDGVAMAPARRGDNVSICRHLSLTSDAPMFHKIVEDLSSFIKRHAQQAGQSLDLERAHDLLLVIREHNQAELWINSAAISVQIAIKRAVNAGEAVFENDIADVLGLGFPAVQLGSSDRLIYLFREKWRFGLFFDLGRNRDLSVETLERQLGTLYRNLKYRNLYDVVNNQVLLDQLFGAGWFPFVEIIGKEFQDLASHVAAGFELADAEAKLLAKFDDKRVDQILERWLHKPHFASKEALLRSAISSFKAGDPVPVIKIILTEIEGVLSGAYRAVHGKGAKLRDLLEFAIDSAQNKTGSPNSLLFAQAFAQYLLKSTFANFDPAASTGTAASRHAVGHGAAVTESYTRARSLQALLILDQLAFYT